MPSIKINQIKLNDGNLKTAKVETCILDYSLDTLKLKLKGDDFIVNDTLIEIDFSTAKGSKDLRKKLYKEGLDFCVNGKTNHYVRYKRTASNSRKGTCLFINEKVLKESDIDSWNKAGLYDSEETKKKIKENLLSFEAYQALTLSGLDDEKSFFNLDPSSILFLEDVKSEFQNHDSLFIRQIEQKGNGKIVFELGDYVVVEDHEQKIANKIWDGESLLDSSVFESIDIKGEKPYKDKGMILLRNRFFKTCGFNTDIKKWFVDNGFNLDEKVDLSRINGYTGAKTYGDIKMITTYSSLKYLKFFDEGHELAAIKKWIQLCKNSPFGIVKADKETNYFSGEMVRLSYQVINTLMLDEDNANRLADNYINFLERIHNNYELFLAFINNYKSHKSDNTKNELSLNDIKNRTMRYLLNRNKGISNTSLFRHYNKKFMDSLKSNGAKGRLLVHGTNATMLSNPIQLLEHTIKKFNVNDIKEEYGSNYVYCKHFDYNKELLAARSPHIIMGNLYKTTNKLFDFRIDRYIKLTDEIVVVNAIENNMMNRLQGCDFDSDFLMMTDDECICNSFNPYFVREIRPYEKFVVPVEDLHKASSSKRLQLYDADHKTANNNVGTITNLSQKINSLFWDKYWKMKNKYGEEMPKKEEYEILGELYYTNAILSVVVGLEIDAAKKGYSTNSDKLINLIKQKYYDDDQPLPKFFELIKKEKANKKYKFDIKLGNYFIFVTNLSKDKNAIYQRKDDGLFYFDKKAKGLTKKELERIKANGEVYLKLIRRIHTNSKNKVIGAYVEAVVLDRDTFVSEGVEDLETILFDMKNDREKIYYVRVNCESLSFNLNEYDHYDTPMDYIYERIKNHSFNDNEKAVPLKSLYSDVIINTKKKDKRYKDKAEGFIKEAKKIAKVFEPKFSSKDLLMDYATASIDVDAFLILAKKTFLIGNHLDLRTIKYIFEDLTDTIGVNYGNVRTYHYLLLFSLTSLLTDDEYPKLFKEDAPRIIDNEHAIKSLFE